MEILIAAFLLGALLMALYTMYIIVKIIQASPASLRLSRRQSRKAQMR